MTDVVLSAERHFEALRDPVWRRFRARHAAMGRDRFEDAYAEWWTRELERAAAGRPSSAAAPVPFVTEAVHRVLIDEGRARARGIARSEKAALQLTHLDAVVDAGGRDDTEAQARYEALAHRVLGLVRDRLTGRELQVFVCTFLYLQSTEETARFLGLSAPRVKKDRVKVAARVGDEVWALVTAELDVCAASPDGRLAALFEVLADHVEDCGRCAASFGGLRRGALAVVGPFELLALAGPEPAGTLFGGIYERVGDLVHRWGMSASALPGSGRGAAAAAAAVVAVAGGGGAAVVAGTGEADRNGPRTASSQRQPEIAPRVVATPTAIPAAATKEPRRAASKRRRRRASAGPGGPVATATPVPTPAPSAPVPTPQDPAPPSSSGEFGFERR